MAYQNFLGEFVVSTNDDWPKTIQYVERRPYSGPGFNPWEIERQRRVWLQEQAAWVKIQTLKREYVSIEKQMETDISIFNSHLAELERVTKKKPGLGPIGSYGGMALAVLPGFGWASAVFSAVSMLFEMIGGNKLKKRVSQLMRIMEEAQARLQQNQQRLIAIQEELHHLVKATERAKAENEAIVKRDTVLMKIAEKEKDRREQSAADARRTELAVIRQRNPFKVHYASDL